jgi:predicted aspartyl protease
LAPASQTSSDPIPSISPPPPAPAKLRDPYKLALDKASSAGNISQSARSQDDWNLVANRWQQAIQLLNSVPASSPYRALVKPKLAEYQRNLAYAKKQATQATSSEVAFDPGVVIQIPLPPTSSVTTTKPQTPPANSSVAAQKQQVFRARIKRRDGGTPVIDVTFNGQRTYEMIVDTGASGTVITQEMAAALGVSVVGKTKVDTASQQDVEVSLAYMHSIAAGGRAVKGVIVAIGGPALEIGLLGHDFFDGYDVTIRRDVVEFHPQ